jgi:ribosomal protein L12E/L44/L45/RPP1/RPP2
MAKVMVGIGFYRREQWPLLLEAADDSHILEKTYDEWLDVVDTSIDAIKAHGLEPKLVDVDVDELISFCRKEGLRNNAGARSKFIAKIFGERICD